MYIYSSGNNNNDKEKTWKTCNTMSFLLFAPDSRPSSGFWRFGAECIPAHTHTIQDEFAKHDLHTHTHKAIHNNFLVGRVSLSSRLLSQYYRVTIFTSIVFCLSLSLSLSSLHFIAFITDFFFSTHFDLTQIGIN